MSDPVVGIKDLLVAASVGTFGAASGWGIYIGKSPDLPDTCVTIYAAGGASPNPKWLLDFPSVQIIIRGSEDGYVAARAKAQVIKDTLLGLPSQDLNGDRWVGVWQVGDITPMGFDQKQRPLFSLNYRLIIEPADGTDNRDPL